MQNEAIQKSALREAIAGRIDESFAGDGSVEPVSGLHLHRISRLPGPLPGISKPAFCVIAQGAKEIRLGQNRYQYDPDHFLVASIELPITSRVIEASPARPYLSLRLDLDPVVVGSVIVEADLAGVKTRTDVSAIGVSYLDSDLLDAILRLVRVSESPTQAHYLVPLITREIVYRLLIGDQGERLRGIAIHGGYSHRILGAIERLRNDFAKPLSIATVANELGMSVSGLHHHFKAVTAMTPLQFQKQLRMQEARRLIVGEDLDAASAGYRVGYDDASYFSRDYKRFYGSPPMRDAARLRETAITGTGL